MQAFCQIMQPAARTILCFTGLLLCASYMQARGQTITFTNDAGGSIWNIGGNWDSSFPPTTIQTAIFPNGVNGTDGGAPWIYLTTGSLSTSASVGTLIITADPFNYRQMLIRPTGTAIGAEITFGSSSVDGAIVYDPVFDQDSGRAFDFGPGDLASAGSLTINIPRRLNVSLAEDTSRFDILGRVVGAGSIVVNSEPGTGFSSFEMGDVNSATSEFSGGIVINPNVRLFTKTSSMYSSGSIVSAGPVGIGTVTLNGGEWLMGAGSGTVALIGNRVETTAESTVRAKSRAALNGIIRTNDNRLHIQSNLSFTFENSGWSAMDTGTITIDDFSAGTVIFNVDSGTSTYGGYVNAMGESNLAKAGLGAFQASHFRVRSMVVNAGTLTVLQDGTTVYGDTGTDNTNRVNALAIAGSDIAPDGTLDLNNGKLIVDYDSTSPMGGVYDNGTITASGHAAQIKAAWNAGSWNGNGITSSLAAGTTLFGVGYAEAGNLGSTTFGGQSIDSTSVLVRFTYYADADLSGVVSLNDFTRLGAAFGLTNKLWSDGDSDYDGVIDLDDFTIMSANFGLGQLARGGPPRLQELYVALLNYPQIYWEARGSSELWANFEPFESMNLGTIPAMPEAMRGIPEPASAAVALLALTATMKRSRRRE